MVIRPMKKVEQVAVIKLTWGQGRSGCQNQWSRKACVKTWHFEPIADCNEGAFCKTLWGKRALGRGISKFKDP